MSDKAQYRRWGDHQTRTRTLGTTEQPTHLYRPRDVMTVADRAAYADTAYHLYMREKIAHNRTWEQARQQEESRLKRILQLQALVMRFYNAAMDLKPFFEALRHHYNDLDEELYVNPLYDACNQDAVDAAQHTTRLERQIVDQRTHIDSLSQALVARTDALTEIREKFDCHCELTPEQACPKCIAAHVLEQKDRTP